MVVVANHWGICRPRAIVREAEATWPATVPAVATDRMLTIWLETDPARAPGLTSAAGHRQVSSTSFLICLARVEADVPMHGPQDGLGPRPAARWQAALRPSFCTIGRAARIHSGAIALETVLDRIDQATATSRAAAIVRRHYRSIRATVAEVEIVRGDQAATMAIARAMAIGPIVLAKVAAANNGNLATAIVLAMAIAPIALGRAAAASNGDPATVIARFAPATMDGPIIGRAASTIGISGTDIATTTS